MSRHEVWIEYVRRITDGVPRKAVAEAAGTDVSALSRWSQGQRPSAEKAISFARGLGQRPVEALIAAGYLEPQEVRGTFEVQNSVANMSDKQLVGELAERLEKRGGLSDELDNLNIQFAPSDDLA